MSDLNKKLMKIQKELKAPKGQYNSFGKYRYRSAEDILEAVKPLNIENGLLLTLSDEAIVVGDWNYNKATARLTDGENEIIVTANAREAENKKGMDASQITGTASSYSRKYALNGLYLIDVTKDADTDEYTKQSNNQPKKQTQDEQVGRATVLSKWKISRKSEEEFNKWHAKHTAEGKSKNEQDASLTKAVANKKSGKHGRSNPCQTLSSS